MATPWKLFGCSKHNSQSPANFLRVKSKRTSRLRLQTERLEERQLLAAHPFHNEAIPEDVNQDGNVSAVDALIVMNEMKQPVGAEALAQHDCMTVHMTDVNNDGHKSPVDALMVVDHLNRGAYGQMGQDSVLNMQPDIEPQDQQAPTTTEETEDVVLGWNNLFNEILVANEEKQNPGYASRAMAMLNLSIYDAVSLASGNSESAFYEYDEEVIQRSNSDKEVAASDAAYTVLSELYPEQQDMIDSYRDRVFSDQARNVDSDGNSSNNLGTGVIVGEQLLEARSKDGFDTIVDYEYKEGIGSFQPDPLNPDVPVWGPAWGSVQPFAMSSADDYVPSSPPEITSERYAESYNEVLSLGSVDSPTRTADQTEAGIFWAYDRVGLGTPMALFNDALESISVQQENTFEENAALYAQASVAMADAGTVAWQSKFGEEFWRPVTAIHQGDDDGNPLTNGDLDWTALGAPDGGDDIIGFTPQFPTYVSGHATFGGALFGAIREFYGTDDIAFDLKSKELEILLDDPDLQEAYGLELQDATRSFDSLTEAMAENGRSRVYLGIHFDFDDTVGQSVGQSVASAVSSYFEVPGKHVAQDDSC